MLWFWGLAGAFIYAAPRWVIGLASTEDTKMNGMLCTVEMIVALAVGSIAAAAFGPALAMLALTTMHIREDNAVSAVVGLFANRIAPEVVDKGSSAFSSAADIGSRVLKALRGNEK